jgi:hypothetical protein
MLKSRRLNVISKDPGMPAAPSARISGAKKGVVAGILLAALLSPVLARADCTKLIDKHLEYYNGIKDHLETRQSFDPGIKTIPYDVKIIDNNAQQYPLLTPNESFFYPNTADRSSDFGFQGAEWSGNIPAICIIQTPDGTNWVVWRDDIRLWFFDEDEQPH